jgi:hypothetical protein
VNPLLAAAAAEHVPLVTRDPKVVPQAR